MKKYFNDAIIGNKNLVASLSKTGELLRICYPNTDFRQFIDFFHVGLTANDSNIIYLHDDINNEYLQYYDDNTNILNTEILNTYFKIKIMQTDFAPIGENIIIRRYKIVNQNNIDLKLNFLIHSKLITDVNNQVSGFLKENELLQYSHDYTLGISSKWDIKLFQINNANENIDSGSIGGKDYIGMSSDSAIGYDLDVLKPKQEIIVDICLNIRETNKKGKSIKSLDIKKLYDETKKYWEKYVKAHDTLEIGENVSKKIQKIYNRTILLFPLLTNYSTGGISAGMEIDENKTKCGRYSYCWPRDAIFIANSMQILKMDDEVKNFYNDFCRNTQSKNGMWEQRFYTDGTLAPCWGYQIDETASVIYGVKKFYDHTKNIDFLKDNLKMCEKATDFLIKYTDDVLEEKHKMFLSYDLWEENEGVHAYSMAAIFAGITSMMEIYDILLPQFTTNRLKQEKIRKQNLLLRKRILQIKEYIIKTFYDNKKKSFVRNDGKIDISLLGLVTPFNVFTPKDKRILNTIERMNMCIRTYTGGYLRYEGDNYAGGNPWVIANLWLADYYIEAGEKKKAKECFDFVVKSCTGHGFLGEQVDNSTMKPAWVIGLGWSHAMFVIVLKKLMK